MRYSKWTLLLATAFISMPLYAVEAQSPATQPAGPSGVEATLDSPRYVEVPSRPGDQYRVILQLSDKSEDADSDRETHAAGQQLERARQLARGAQHGNHETKKGAWLGVSATPAPLVLRKQLELPEGMGLVVDAVIPDSPAGKAGLKQYDVLQKLDDQLLANSQQFAALVRMHKPGDSIKLTVIRGGKTVVLDAKLAEHALEPLADAGAEIDRFWYDIPEPFVRPLLPNAPPVPHDIHVRGPWSATWIDGDRAYTVARDWNGHRVMIVKDLHGKDIFRGPIDTAAQREKLPADARQKLEKMQPRLPVELQSDEQKKSPAPPPAPTPDKGD